MAQTWASAQVRSPRATRLELRPKAEFSRANRVRRPVLAQSSSTVSLCGFSMRVSHPAKKKKEKKKLHWPSRLCARVGQLGARYVTSLLLLRALSEAPEVASSSSSSSSASSCSSFSFEQLSSCAFAGKAKPSREKGGDSGRLASGLSPARAGHLSRRPPLCAPPRRPIIDQRNFSGWSMASPRSFARTRGGSLEIQPPPSMLEQARAQLLRNSGATSAAPNARVRDRSDSGRAVTPKSGSLAHFRSARRPERDEPMQMAGENRARKKASPASSSAAIWSGVGVKTALPRRRHTSASVARPATRQQRAPPI